MPAGFGRAHRSPGNSVPRPVEAAERPGQAFRVSQEKLNEARSQGDVLIVGLNSDASVRSHKGPTRPIISDRGRAKMLLALRVVDYVHIFDEPDPIAFLSELNPDVHVNGAEYGENCIERDVVIRNGGRLHLVDRIPNLSTSALAGQL